MASGNHPFRPLFPAALLLFGAAASCWCACFSGPSAAQTGNTPQRQLQQRLAEALPPPAAKSAPNSQRLQVTGNWPHFQVTAIGDFSADGARAFVDRASRVILLGQKPGLTITIYNDAGGARALVGTFTIDPAGDLEHALLANLPAPLDEIPPGAIKIHVIALAHENHFNISITGPFTPEGANAMEQHVREIYRTEPEETRFNVHLLKIAAGHPVLLKNFDPALDP